MQQKTKRKVPSMAASALAGLLAGGVLAGEAQAQFKTGFTGVGFSDEISGVQTDMAGLLQVLKDHTLLAGDTTRMSRIAFVYGIVGPGDAFGDPVVSRSVHFVPGDPKYIELGSGPMTTPWDAFSDPLLGFTDPLFGFTDPLLGFTDPLLGFDSVDSFTDPLLGLQAVWGNGNVTLESDEYGLVLFTMPDPSAQQSGASITHTSAIVPFRVQERP